MYHEYNLKLLQEFDLLTESLRKTHKNFYQLSHDIFLLKNHENQIDLFINCCTHGNEIIGLIIINNLLKKIKDLEFLPTLNLAFSIGNREAVLTNQRLIHFDLNRCFSKKNPSKSSEDTRAGELEIIAQKSNAILDIHQTSSESLSPFFIIKDINYNLSYLNFLEIYEWPLILYKEGNFSKDGEAFSSFCFSKKIPFITVELGLAGSNVALEDFFIKKILYFIKNINPSNWKKSLSPTNEITAKNPVFREFLTIEKKSEDDYLVDGIKNLSPIKKGMTYAYQDNQALKTEEDLFALFPKYGFFKKNSSELIRFLKQHQ